MCVYWDVGRAGTHAGDRIALDSASREVDAGDAIARTRAASACTVDGASRARLPQGRQRVARQPRGGHRHRQHRRPLRSRRGRAGLSGAGTPDARRWPMGGGGRTTPLRRAGHRGRAPAIWPGRGDGGRSLAFHATRSCATRARRTTSRPSSSAIGLPECGHCGAGPAGWRVRWRTTRQASEVRRPLLLMSRQRCVARCWSSSAPTTRFRWRRQACSNDNPASPVTPSQSEHGQRALLAVGRRGGSGRVAALRHPGEHDCGTRRGERSRRRCATRCNVCPGREWSWRRAAKRCVR